MKTPALEDVRAFIGSVSSELLQGEAVLTGLDVYRSRPQRLHWIYQPPTVLLQEAESANLLQNGVRELWLGFVRIWLHDSQRDFEAWLGSCPFEFQKVRRYLQSGVLWGADSALEVPKRLCHGQWSLADLSEWVEFCLMSYQEPQTFQRLNVVDLRLQKQDFEALPWLHWVCAKPAVGWVADSLSNLGFVDPAAQGWLEELGKTLLELEKNALNSWIQNWQSQNSQLLGQSGLLLDLRQIRAYALNWKLHEEPKPPVPDLPALGAPEGIAELILQFEKDWLLSAAAIFMLHSVQKPAFYFEQLRQHLEAFQSVVDRAHWKEPMSFRKWLLKLP